MVTAVRDDATVAETLTDENGYYSLPLPEGPYTLIATSDGYGQVSVDLEVTEPVTVDFELIRKNSVYGVVTDRSGNPLQGILVEVLDSDYNFLTDTLTGPGGRYLVDLEGYLDDEPAILRIMFSGDMVFDEEETVTVNPRDSVRVDHEMERVTIIMGTMKGSGTVAPGIPLDIYYEDQEGEGRLTVFTDDSGLYFIEVPEDIAGAVTAAGVNSYGYMEYRENITLTPFTINTINIDLQEKAVLHVTAVNRDGDTLDNVLFSVSNGDVYREMPAPSGEASFAVEEGEVLLRALRALYSTYQDAINITAQRTEITVTLSRPGLPSGVEGHVTDRRTGEAIPYAEVNLRYGIGEGSVNLYTYTDEDGSYSFSHMDYPSLVSGLPCELYVYRDGYRVYSRQITLPEGTLECDAELERLTILTGIVMDPDGEIIYTPVTLSCMVDGSVYESTVMNDESGYYGFYDIPESDDGLYTLSVEDWRYRPFNETLPLNASDHNYHDIIMGFYDGYLMVNIRDRNGAPVEGVLVTLQGPGTIHGMSGADGTTEFMHLPDHEWTLTASHPSYVPINRTVIIEDGGSEYLTLELTRKGLPVTFQGHVYGADQTPLSGVRIWFWPSNQTWTTIYTTTDSNGFYNLSTGRFPAMVSGLTGVLETYVSHYRDTRTWMMIDEGVTIHDIHLELWPSNITLNVTDNMGGPVSDLTVYAFCSRDSFDAVTGPDGTAVLNNVPSDEYWEFMCWDSRYFDWDGYYYVLEDDQNLTVDIILVPRTAQYPLKGKVTDRGGVPIAGAVVEVQLINGNTPYTYRLTTNSTGDFRSYTDTANLMRVTISRDGYMTLTRDMMPQDLPFDGVFILETEASQTGTVEGYVRDFTGNPLGGVQILASRTGFPGESTFTDSSGYYRFDLPAGSYLLTPQDSRYIIMESMGTTIAPGITVNINFTLLPKNSVYGYVYLMVPDGALPADGATVELTGSAGTFQTVTLEDGRYQVQAPGPGEYTIRASYPFYLDGTGTVTLTGDAVNENFHLYYGPFSGVHGTVTDSLTGSPLEGVVVTLTCWEGEFPVYELTCVTDEFGAYGFSSLQPIDYYYSLAFMKDGYLPLDIFLWPGPGIGEDMVLDAALNP